MGSPARRLASVGTLVALLGAGIAALPTAKAADPPVGPGCDPSRPAVAHHANGQALDPQPAGAPVPCLTKVGRTTDSANAAVTNSGAVFFAPVGQLDRPWIPPPTTPPGAGLPGVPVGAVAAGVLNTQLTIVARSTDDGAYWHRIVPGPKGVPLSSHGVAIPWLSVDPETSRIWYATPPSYCGVNVSWSDDDGETWDKTVIPCPAQGSNALIEGPAPEGGAQPTGNYPHVVYYCANLGESPFASRSHLVCHKSLDGGRTFIYNALQTPDSVPPREECGGPTGFSAETRPGAVGPKDGVLYFPQNVCGEGKELRVAVSRDEGATWQSKHVAFTEVQVLYPPAIAADVDNNLYLSWRGAGALPYLSISRDNGETWSTPAQIGAPGVNNIRQVAVTARDAGHVAVSYLGSTNNGETFNAYITESRNALDQEPFFWSGALNAPDQPMALGTETPSLGDRIQFLHGMIGPDGTPWAGFHCAYTVACPGVRIGVAGRLARPTTE